MLEPSSQWYVNSIKELQAKLVEITEHKYRYELHNEGGWDKYLVRLDVCRDLLDKLVEEARTWR